MAAAAPVPSCKVRCKLLPNSRERRNLTSAASASVVAMIKEICSNLSLSAENFVVQMADLVSEELTDDYLKKRITGTAN